MTAAFAIGAGVLFMAIAAGATGSGAPDAAASAAATVTPLAWSCTGCHRPNSRSREIPSLARRSPAFIAASLRRSRDAPRPGSIMARFAAKLSDEDIASLARQLGRATARRPATPGRAAPR